MHKQFSRYKKGNKEGTTQLAQSCNPDFIAGKLLLEKINKQAVKHKKINAKKFLLTLKTKKLQECIIPSIIAIYYKDDTNITKMLVKKCISKFLKFVYQIS